MKLTQNERPTSNEIDQMQNTERFLFDQTGRSRPEAVLTADT
jgi:hypothetical protein